MRALAFPFRFSRGRAVTLDADDDAYAAQEIVTAVSTRVGELPLRPQFGTEAPEFAEFDRAGFYYTCSVQFPEIQIKSVDDVINAQGQIILNIEFDVLREDPINGLT